MSDDPRRQRPERREGTISHTYDANGNLQWTDETHTWTDCGINDAGQHALDNLPQGSLTASFDESATVPPPPSTAEILALIQQAYRLKDEWMPDMPANWPIVVPREPAKPFSFDDIIALYDKLTPAPRQPSAYRAHPDTFASLPRAKPSPSASLDALLGVPVIPDDTIPVGQFKAEHYWPHEPAETALEPPDPGDTDTDQHEANSGRLKTFLAVTAIVAGGLLVIAASAALAIFYGAGRWW